MTRGRHGAHTRADRGVRAIVGMVVDEPAANYALQVGAQRRGEGRPGAVIPIISEHNGPGHHFDDRRCLLQAEA